MECCYGLWFQIKLIHSLQKFYSDAVTDDSRDVYTQFKFVST